MFKLNLLESIKNIDKNKTMTYLTVFLFALIFLLQGYTMSYYAAKNIITGHFDHESLVEYHLYELGCHGAAPLQAQKACRENIELETAEYFADLENSEYITYVGLDSSGLYINLEAFKGDMQVFSRRAHNDSDSLWCLYVTPNFYEVENYRVIEGRNFTAEDMPYVEGKPRAVLLGYKYMDLYEVGDIIDVEYNEGTAWEYIRQLEVIGFLAEDTTVMERAGNEIYDLDNYIVYPEYIIPIDEWDNYDEVIVENSLNRDYGYAFSDIKIMFTEENEAQGLIDWQTAIDNYGKLGGFYRILDTEYSMEKLTSRFEIVTSFFAEITAVMIFFSTITVLISIANRVSRNMKDYAIHIAVGATRGSTIWFIISEMAIILTCSIILGIIATKWLMYYMNMPFYFWQFLGVYVLTSVIILALSAIVARLAIRKYDICTLIK